MEKVKVYVIAKVTGVPYEEVKSKYECARDIIEFSGEFEVVIPIDHIHEQTDWHSAMKIAIPLLCSCEAYTYMDFPHTSAGGIIESMIAAVLKIKYIPMNTF